MLMLPMYNRNIRCPHRKLVVLLTQTD